MKEQPRISVFGKNLRAFRTKQELTQQQVGDSIGVSNTAVNLWETQGVQPRRRLIDALIEQYDLTEDELLSDTNGYYARLHNLTDAIPGALAPGDAKRAYAPLYGRVHAGTAQEPNMLDERIPVPFEIRDRHPRGYFLEVEGTCMNRIYTEHSYIYIDPNREPQEGSIAVFTIDESEYLVRRMKRGAKTLILSPDSDDPQWDDIIITEEDDTPVRFIGTVVWFQSKEELE